jgi:predicted O-linked N-acetylglucosamine transferase (SPINDLY family)
MSAPASPSHKFHALELFLTQRLPEDYVARALRLAQDRNALARLRAGLRARMRASPVCDGKTFTRALEDTYRALWHGWCAQAGEHA